MGTLIGQRPCRVFHQHFRETAHMAGDGQLVDREAERLQHRQPDQQRQRDRQHHHPAGPQAQRQQEKARRLASLELPERQLSRHRRTALDEYRSEMAGLVKRFGDDLSKCDFIAAQKLASRGRSAEEIGKAMAEASPALAERKPGHEADYIERTVSKVMGLPSVQLARAELARAPAPRQRGMDRGGPDFSM